MSYEIVKGIKVEDTKVFLKSTSNNVYPKIYTWWECGSLSRILREEGRARLDLEIMKDYEQGNMQAGTGNKYTRALEILFHMPEYERFNWQHKDFDEVDKNMKENAEEFEALLKKALRMKLPKQKYILTKEVQGQKLFFNQRKNSLSCKWYTDKSRATKFNYKEDAESTKKYFTYSDSWQTELLQ